MSTYIIDDFKLIELVQQNNHLYDKNNSEYRDMLKKTITWKAIGAALGASGELCRKRFRCLRDRFNKERKVRQEEMLTDPSLPAVFKKMLFLWDHLTHRRLVPVATRLLLMPADDSNDAQEVTEELEKQILLLKEENVESGKMQNTSNEEVCDSNIQNMVTDSSEETFDEKNENEEENATVSSNVVSEDKHCTPEQRSRILFIKKPIKSNLNEKFVSDIYECSNDKQKLIDEDNNKSEQPSNIDNMKQSITERNNEMPHKKGNRPNLATKFLQNNLKEMFVNDSAVCLNDNLKLNNGDKNECEQPNNDNNKNVEELLETNNKLPLKKGNVSKLPTKRRFLQRSVQRILPKQRKTMASNLREYSSREDDREIDNVATTSRPSCNEAFCIVVKSYLD